MWRNRLWKDTSDAVSDLASNQGTRICHRLLKPCTMVLSSATGAQRGSWGHSDSCPGTINELVIEGQRQGWAGTSRGHLAQLSAQDQSYVRHSWEVVVLFVTAAEARVISRATHTNAWFYSFTGLLFYKWKPESSRVEFQPLTYRCYPLGNGSFPTILLHVGHSYRSPFAFPFG